MWDSIKRFETISFKAVSGGYVLQLPNEWLVGPRRHFLVDETQKAEITASLRPYIRWFAEFCVVEWLGWALPLVLVITFAFAISVGDRALLLFPFLYLVFMLVFAWSIVATIGGMRSIRPILATLPLSAERITLFEIIRRRMRGVSVTLLLLIIGWAGVMATTLTAAGLVFSAFVLVYCGLLLILKLVLSLVGNQTAQGR
jgi:hypothetical protein